MTLYAGETVRISTSATDFDGVVVTDVDVVDTTVEIQNSGGDEVVAATSMSWDAAEQQWFYDWETETDQNGTYIAKCRIEGLSFESWEFKRFRLARNRF